MLVFWHQNWPKGVCTQEHILNATTLANRALLVIMGHLCASTQRKANQTLVLCSSHGLVRTRTALEPEQFSPR